MRSNAGNMVLQMTDSAFAFGLGVGTHNSKGEWLEVFFPTPLLSPASAIVEAVAANDSGTALDSDALQALAAALESAGETVQATLAAQLLDTNKPAGAVLLRTDAPPHNVPVQTSARETGGLS